MLINKESEFLYFTIKNEVRKRVVERMEDCNRVPDNSIITLNTPAITTLISEVLKLLNKSDIRLHTIMLHLKKLNNNFSINTITEYILLVINSNSLISKHSLSKIGTTKRSIEVDKVKDLLGTVILNSTKGDNVKIITGLVDSIFNVDIENILQYHKYTYIPICTTTLAILITQYCEYTPIHKDYITDELVAFIKYLDDEYDLNHNDSSIGIGLDTNVIELLSTSNEAIYELSLELVNKYELEYFNHNDDSLTIQELVNIICTHLLDTHEYLPFNTLNHSYN